MPRNVSLEDFRSIAIVSDPRLSPDGRSVAFVASTVQTEKNRYRGAIWIAPFEGGEPRKFTSGEFADSSPRWSPDGARIAFLSDRDKPKAVIYSIPADGGEPTPLFKLENEGAIQEIRWSPDGNQIAFLYRETPEQHRKDAVEKRKTDELSSPPRRVKRLFYRLDGFGFFDESYWQLWIGDAAAGAARALTSGPFHCGAFSWSPDGKSIAFLSDRREDADLLPSADDIWIVPVEGGKFARVPSPVTPKAALTWSPRGDRLAYAGLPEDSDQWGTRNERVYVLPSTGSNTATDLTGRDDLAVGCLTLSDIHNVGAGDLIQWMSNGDRLLFAASRHGDTRLYSVDANGGSIDALTPERHEMGGFSVSRNRASIAVTLGSPTAPHEIFVGSGAGDLRQRSELNANWLAEVGIAPPEEVRIDNGDGGKVHVWMIAPPELDGSKRYPCVLYVHGGPHAQYGNMLFHELQWLAAEGYVVLYSNPRGSKGYGEAHTQAILGEWGTVDFKDIMAVADYGASLTFVDADRMAIMGGSYGGYMTAWAVGHTDRFRCAIADRLVANLVSMSGTTDFPWRHGTYFKGNAWADPEDLGKRSPLAFANNIDTPLLLIHSEGDLRCPIGQAEEMFAALRLQHKTVELVRYGPETSHGLSRNGPPDMRSDRLTRNREWLDSWLKADDTKGAD